MKLSLRLLVAAAVLAATVSAKPTDPVNLQDAANQVHGGSFGDQTSSFRRSLRPDLCDGLPRNTVLSSCPAPCLPDAPCIVYDQDAALSNTTGCDYRTSSYDSLCTRADGLAQTCELQCFAQSAYESKFRFLVDFKSSVLSQLRGGEREDARWITPPTFRLSLQSNDFVRAIGKLNVSDNIKDIDISANPDPYGRSRYVDVDVDPMMIAGATSLTSLTIDNMPLGSDRAEAVVANAPTTLKTLSLAHSQLTTLSEATLQRLSELEVLKLSENFMTEFAYATPLTSLKELYLESNELSKFNIVAPRLERLELYGNKLVRIPPSIFSLSELNWLVLAGNRIDRPLVLSRAQVSFLDGIQTFNLDFVDTDTPSTAINETNHSDGIDISQYLVNATTVNLREDPALPVLMVSAENAQKYNDLLELRANGPVENDDNTSNETSTPAPSPTPPNGLSKDICLGLPRNTLIDNCSNRWPGNGACVIYDQDLSLSQPTACDYDVASPASFCTNNFQKALTCEFHCFAVYEKKSEFKFLVPLKAELGPKIKRRADGGTLLEFKTLEVPFLTNTFVNKVGSLTLTSSVTEVSISGGRNLEGTRGQVADLVVNSTILAKTPSVTSLSLTNIDLRLSNLAAILASAPALLKSLDLQNTLLSTLSEGIFASTQQLETLTLTENDLATLSATAMSLPKLKRLYLGGNALTSLEVATPSLETLDLSGNNLVRIPPSVFELSNLKTLSLQDNPFATPLVLSESQYAFLNKTVTDLKISVSVSQVTVSPSQGTDQTVTTNPTSTSDGTNAVPSQLLVNGTIANLGGVPVIVVTAANAQEYNDRLEQQQKTMTPAPSSRPATTDQRASSANAGSASAAIGETNTANTYPVQQSESSNAPRVGSANNASSPTSSNNSSNSAVDGEITMATTTKSSRLLTSVLVIGGLASAFLVAILALCIIVRRKKTGKNGRLDKLEGGGEEYLAMTENELTVGSRDSQAIPWWRDDDMLSHRLRSSDVNDVRVVGGTNSSITWLVDYRGGSQQLVSKRLIHSEGPAHEAKVLDLFAEAKMAATLSHPSVVPFVGVAWTNKTDLQVLYAYMTNGSLSSYLAQTDATTLPWMLDKLHLAIDIIEALVYTHSFNPPLLHRDLKSSNVLLDDDFKARLGDFGCARPESDSNTMTASEIGTGRWLAPEILLGSTSYGSSSDIYSFGVVLCELDIHDSPYAEEAVEISEATLLQRVARGELRPSVSASCPPEIKSIAEACLAFEANTRPNAMQVAYMLRSLLPRDSND